MATTPLIPWQSLADPGNVSKIIRRYIPNGALVPDVERFAQEQRLEHSEVTDGAIYCSAPATTNVDWTIAKWLLVFRFKEGRLVDLHVDKGLIDP